MKIEFYFTILLYHIRYFLLVFWDFKSQILVQTLLPRVDIGFIARNQKEFSIENFFVEEVELQFDLTFSIFIFFINEILNFIFQNLNTFSHLPSLY